MKISKNALTKAMIPLGKLVNHTAICTAYKSVLIEAKPDVLTLTVCAAKELFSVDIPGVSDKNFSVIVDFIALRNALKGSGMGTVEFQIEDGKLLLRFDMGRNIYTATIPSVEDADFPVFDEAVTKAESVALPENFVGNLAQAAVFIDRKEMRWVLRGIHLSKDGIAATNGKELINIPCALPIQALTIPFPLALMATKAQEAGTLRILPDDNDTTFLVEIGAWKWQGNVDHAQYPNWQRIFRDSSTSKEISFLPDAVRDMIDFLKCVPEESPNTPIVLEQLSTALKLAASKGQSIVVDAEFVGEWNGFKVGIDRNILLRILSAGHLHIAVGDSHTPVIATGGIGRIAAMPLHMPNVPEEKETPQPKPQKEEKKMEEVKTNVVVAPMRPVVTNATQHSEVNPLDELSAGIEEFRVKAKAIFDEALTLTRKVKEVQIAQKQKERDFIQARRAIERIRMAI